jgi:hypothetical protein
VRINDNKAIGVPENQILRTDQADISTNRQRIKPCSLTALDNFVNLRFTWMIAAAAATTTTTAATTTTTVAATKGFGKQCFRESIPPTRCDLEAELVPNLQ